MHYLRTLNPVNPENLAQYPHRLGTNRTNPYELPGGLLKLADTSASPTRRASAAAADPTIAPPDPAAADAACSTRS